MSRAAEFVANALAPEQEFFSMDDLEDILMEQTHFEPDARNRVESAHCEISYGAMETAQLAGTAKPRVNGLRYAMTAPFDERLRNLSEAVVARHRRFPSETVSICDPQKASDGTELPPWDINDPKQANIERGLVASHPHELHVLRGAYTHNDLARRIWDGEIPTLCNVNVASDCDVKASASGYRDQRKVWGIFTGQVGEFLVFHTICCRCFTKMWPMKDEVNFYTFDPSHQTADFLAWQRKWRSWRQLQHSRMARARNR